MDKIKVRRYLSSDKETIYRIKKILYEKYYIELYGKWDEDNQKSFHEQFIKDRRNDIWIIQLNTKDIGFYNGNKIDFNNYEIENICILPEYQNRGIGTQILKYILKVHNNQNILLEYYKKNPVGNLYKRLGFIKYKEEDNHYKLIFKQSN